MWCFTHLSCRRGACLTVCVCLSIVLCDCIKTVQARITKSSLSAATNLTRVSGFTNNKVLLSHFKLLKFSIALVTHVYDNAVAFGLRDFAANEIKFQLFNCPPIGLTAPGGLTLGSVPYFHIILARNNIFQRNLAIVLGIILWIKFTKLYSNFFTFDIFILRCLGSQFFLSDTVHIASHPWFCSVNWCLAEG